LFDPPATRNKHPLPAKQPAGGYKDLYDTTRYRQSSTDSLCPDYANPDWRREQRMLLVLDFFREKP